MVIANTSDGESASFDLARPEQLKGLLRLIRDGRVRALSLHHKGVQHSLPLPRLFHRPSFGAEALFNGTKIPIGERIYCQAGDVRVSLTSTFKGSVIRCDLQRTGKQRFDPRDRDC